MLITNLRDLKLQRYTLKIMIHPVARLDPTVAKVQFTWKKTRKLHVKHRYRRPHVKNGAKKEVSKSPSRALPEATSEAGAGEALSFGVV